LLLGHLNALVCAARLENIAALVAERMMEGFQRQQKLQDKVRVTPGKFGSKSR
jgi:hypothetical protein